MEFYLIVVGSGLAGYGLIEEIRHYSKDMSILILTEDDGHYYSKPALSTGFSQSLSADDLVDKTAAQMAEEFNIDIKSFTTVTELNPELNQLRVDGVTYNYKKLVLATGASPIRLSWPEDVNSMVFPINNRLEYQEFSHKLTGKNRVAVIGSGLVGAEYANDLAMAGKQVSVISMDERLLQRLVPCQISDALQTRLGDLGVRFEFDSKVIAGHLNTEQELELTLSNGQQLKVDIILSAVGLSPNLHLAAEAGIATGHGIKVDLSLQTSAKNVYALGDCAEIQGLVRMYLIPLNLSIKALARTLTAADELPVKVSFGAMPVLVKTPSCGIVCVPPPSELKGQWRVAGEAPHLQAEFVDEEGKLSGFALSGKKLLQRMTMLRQLTGNQ